MMSAKMKMKTKMEREGSGIFVVSVSVLTFVSQRVLFINLERFSSVCRVQRQLHKNGRSINRTSHSVHRLHGQDYGDLQRV